jgi:nucleoside-diphosphate-sugar epimerase
MTDLADDRNDRPQRGVQLIVGLGFLGRAVADLWLAADRLVHATTRSAARADELRRLGLVPVLWDVLRSEGSLPAADRVLYAVGFDRTSGDAMRSVSIDGLKRTLDRLPTPRRLVYLSSTGVYGDHSGGWVDERTPPNPADEAGRICLAAESIVRQFATDRGASAVILRLAGLYGPGRVIGAKALQAGEPIAGDPDAFVNLIHVVDAARVVDAAFRATNPSPLYVVADGRPARRRELYEESARRLAAPPPRFIAGPRPRQRGDRRVDPRKMLAELAIDLRYPDFRAGLSSIASLDPARPNQLEQA